MISQDLTKFKLPDSPGVYFFKNGRTILYIGKATSLRDRVRSYFRNDLEFARGQKIIQMVAKASVISFEKTDSVLEALLLEAVLIKKHQPHFNTDEKDDKSFNSVVISSEKFPRVLVIRKRELDSFPQDISRKPQAVFGPFPHGLQLSQAMKIIRKILPYRDGKCVSNLGKPCFNRQIGLCPGVCTGEISKEAYARTIRNIKLLFLGKKGHILRNLKMEMRQAAKNQYFERAGEIKKTLFALEHIQDISLLKKLTLSTDSKIPYRIESYDVAHTSGTSAVAVMAVLEDGYPKKSEYRKFIIKGPFGNNDIYSLIEVVNRRLNHKEWSMPSLVVTDGGIAQKNAVEKIIGDRKLKIQVVSVIKNDRHVPKKILGDEVIIAAKKNSILLANNEAHRFAIKFHGKLRHDSFIKSR